MKFEDKKTCYMFSFSQDELQVINAAYFPALGVRSNGYSDINQLTFRKYDWIRIRNWLNTISINQSKEIGIKFNTIRDVINAISSLWPEEELS